jgi:outer membrane protein TolC
MSDERPKVRTTMFDAPWQESGGGASKRGADRHYRLGAVPIATYVELQKAYLEAVGALLDTKREALEAGLKLQQLTGLDFKPVDIAP